MIDIKELTNDEIAEWCEIVSHQFIKEYFKRNSKSYNKLIKTVSTPVAKLINPEIEKIVQSNKSNKFISEVYNDLTEPILKEIKEEIFKSVEGRIDEIWATCEALLKSCFRSHFDLYFKLTETDSNVTNAALVKNISDLMRQVNGISELVSKNRELESQKADSDKEIEELKVNKSEYEAKISELNANIEKEASAREKAEKDVSDLTKELEYANNEIENLKSEKAVPVVIESEHKYLKNSDFEYTSICKVIYIPQKDKNMLKRLADINEDGELKIFFTDDEILPQFDNRDLLYLSDNKNIDVDTLAVWDWRAVENNRDSSKDFIISSLNITASPIFRINGEFQKQKLISSLKSGITVPNGNLRFMFIIREGSNHFGIVVSKDKCKISDNILKINSNVICLPKYKVSPSFDFIQIGTDMYYHSLNLSNFVDYEYIKYPIEAVKDIVVGRATRKAFNAYGLNTKEGSAAQKFIEDIPTDDLLREIQDRFNCSLKKAKEYLDEFSIRANEFFEGSTEENQALLNAINSSPELYEKCEEAVRTDWERQNFEMINRADGELNRIKAEAEAKKSELQHFEEQLAEKEKMAEEVNKKVAEKIQSAQNNAAEFISTMAFVNPMVGKPAISASNSAVVRSGKNIENAEPKEINSFEDWLDLCLDNFNSLGIYVDEFSDSLAVLMYTAYIKKIPLILSGPGARKIADAFSCSMFGKTAAYVNCIGDCSNYILDEITLIPDEIVVIDNAFSTAWINHIMNFINIPKKFYILVQPFSEDILIEPKGILNYAVPIFTEFLVENIPDQINYTVPIFGEEFKFADVKFTEISNDVKYNNKYFRQLSLCSIVKNRLKTLLGNVKIMADGNIISDLTLGIIPLAYITGNSELIKEALDNEDFSPSTKETLKAFLGAENDDTITNS